MVFLLVLSRPAVAGCIHDETATWGHAANGVASLVV
jgi:hypothetical protein